MINAGLCYENGEGVEQSFEKAFELFKKAADAGHTDGMVTTGHCSTKGEGVEQNACMKAAGAGQAVHAFHEGDCHEKGEGGRKRRRSSCEM